MNRSCGIPNLWRTLAAETPGSVLLETARPDEVNRRSLLFVNPVQTLSASTPDEIPEVFRRIEEAISAGFHAAGFLSYECGYHFQGVDSRMANGSGLPLLWFGLYRDPLIHEHYEDEEAGAGRCLPLDSTTETHSVSWTNPNGASLSIPEDEYCAKIERIKEYIVAGDTYQVNFTDWIDLTKSTEAITAFAALSHRQRVPYSAFLHLEGRQILSFSPELFFRIENGRIIARPMKGTMPRGLDSPEDDKTALRLRDDEKNRAEHVMIVDLIRNDLGRLCKMGSIRVEDLFSVEKYSTLFQMTSTITGDLRPDLTYYEIFKSMFPSGSITGAPKVRTMEIIRELEASPREIYTGAIGFIAPDRSATFNVAIRTLDWTNASTRMGVGGGIVADSSASGEYRECLLKASFLNLPRLDFQLFETILWDQSLVFPGMHLDRMDSSATYFEFPFDRSAITARLMELSNQLQAGRPYRIKLTLDSAGNASIHTTVFVPEPGSGRILLSSERTSSNDVLLRHKTTRRERYDQWHAKARAAGMDEVLFMNERDEITEGAISNVFVRREGRLFTPPLSSGVLPGVFRRHLLETEPTAVERVLHLHDLQSADEIFLCNSVRGIRPIKSLWPDSSSQGDLLAQ